MNMEDRNKLPIKLLIDIWIGRQTTNSFVALADGR